MFGYEAALIGQDGIRVWKGAASAFQVEAELVDVREGKVELKKRDGSTILVDIEDLSLSDTRYVTEVMRKARLELTNEALSRRGSRKPSNRTIESSSKEVQSINKADFDGSTYSDVFSAESTTKSHGSEQETEPLEGLSHSELNLGQVWTQDVVFPKTPSASFLVSRLQPGSRNYQVANIRTAKLSPPFSISGFGQAKALSPDGRMLATIEQQPTRLSLYATDTGKITREIPLDELRMVQSLCFLNAEKVLVFGHGNQIRNESFIVDLKEKNNPVSSISLNGYHAHLKYAISFDGRFFAFASHPATIHCIDLTSGKPVLETVVSVRETNGHGVIQDICFNRDATELYVLSATNSTSFHVLSVQTGKERLQHRFAENLSNICPNRHSYLARPIELIPNERGWLLFGTCILDHELGCPVWLDEPRNGQHARTLLFRTAVSEDRFVSVIQDASGIRTEMGMFPWQEIEKTKSMIANGGSIEDVGLPQFKKVNLENVPLLSNSAVSRPYQGIPMDSPEAVDPQFFFGQISSQGISELIFSNARHPSVAFQSFDSSHSERTIQVFDTSQGTVRASIGIDAPVRILHLSPDGRWVVTSPMKPGQRFDVYDMLKQTHAAGFRLEEKSDSTFHVSCRFLSETRLLSQTANRTGIVWDTSSWQPIYRIASAGTAYPFPSSERFLHLVENQWLVRSSKNGEPLGHLQMQDAKEMIHASSIPVAFRQNETSMAALLEKQGSRYIGVWDLLSGSRIKTVPLHDVEGTMTGISWCDSNTVALRLRTNPVNNNRRTEKGSSRIYLVSLEDERVVWRYLLPEGNITTNASEGRLWFSEGNAQGVYKLFGIRIPTEMFLSQARERMPAKPFLQRGDQIALEISVGFAGDRLADDILADQVRNLLKKSFEDYGIQISENAALKLSLRVEPEGPRRFGIPPNQKMDVVCTITNITNKELWHRRTSFQNAILPFSSPGDQQASRKQEWEKTTDWISATVVPSKIYQARSLHEMGASQITARGEMPIQTDANQ